MVTALPDFSDCRPKRNVPRGGRRYGSAPEAVFSSACRLAVALALFSISFIPLKVSGQEISLTDRIEKATTLIGDNRIQEAERELNTVLRIRPRDAAALDLLGTIRARSEERRVGKECR